MMKLIISGNNVKDIKEQIMESAMIFLQESAASPMGPNVPIPAPATPPPQPPEPPQVIPVVSGAVDVVPPPPEPAEPIPPVASEPVPKKKNPGGRPPTKHLAVAPPVLDPNKVYTKDEAIGLLTEVNQMFNIDRARECLARFKVSRFSELKEDQHQEFALHCQEVLSKKLV